MYSHVTVIKNTRTFMFRMCHLAPLPEVEEKLLQFLIDFSFSFLWSNLTENRLSLYGKLCLDDMSHSDIVS